MKIFTLLFLMSAQIPLKIMVEENITKKLKANNNEEEKVLNPDVSLTIQVEEVTVLAEEPQKRKVLDGKVIPEHYDLRVNVEKNGFDGIVKIKVKIVQATNVITLNSKGLELSNVKFIAGEETFDGRISLKDETAIFSFDKILAKDIEGEISVNYKGEYNKGLEGFYVSDYNGKPIYSTHFEPTDARSAFPCFDQPDMKATFSISISADENLTVLSNSSLEKQEGNVRYFEKTKKMSTYLVAYVIGSLSYVEEKTARGVPIRVYSDESEVSWGEYPAKVAKECVEYFEKYFGIEYPFPKIDMVAIPAFAMGAMENWGLITYRRSSLLYNEKSSSVRAKKGIAETVCHELAHMWFGNLVTMKWWDDLWLNEGFATWASNLAVDNLSKKLVDWDVWTGFANYEIEVGMAYDSLHSTHPIAVEVIDPHDINQIFDSISYCKGASLIRMLENYIGHDNFRKGISEYLKTFEYSNASTSDLWYHLNRNANKDSQENSNTSIMMDMWVKREGFPLITVKDTGKTITLEQTRFFKGEKNNDSDPWIIPVKINFIGKGIKDFEFKDKVMEIEKESEIYKLNVGSTGFYRVIYPEENLKLLMKEKLSDADRLNLVNDSYALALASYIKIKNVIEEAKTYKNENNHEILESLLQSINQVSSIFYNEEKVVDYLSSVVRGIVEDRALKVDLTGKNRDNRGISLDDVLIRESVSNKSPKVIEKMEKIWDEYLKDESKVAPEFRRSLFRAVVDKKFDEVLKTYKEGKTPESKSIAILALSRSESVGHIEYILKNLTTFAVQDSHYLFAGLSTNYKNRDFVVNWLMENIDYLHKHLNNSSLFNSCIEYIFSSVSTKELGEKVKDLLSKTSYEGSSRTIRKIAEKIDIRIKFRVENENIIE